VNLPSRYKPSAVIFAVAACCLSCSVFVEKSDYADYRLIRLARSEEQSLLAMKAYVHKHPDGHWHDEVQQSRTETEARYFEKKKGSRQGLKEYLRFYPNGTFAEQARSRLKAFGQVNRRKAQERQKTAEVSRERQALEEERRRSWVTRFYAYWIGVLLSIDNWGAPIDQVVRDNAVFARAFGESPRPVCTQEQCVKSFRSKYAIPVPSGTRIERTIEVDVRLQIKQSRLKSAQIVLLKRGFSRWFETENGLVSFDEDESFRQKAIDWAQDKIAVILREATGRKELREIQTRAPERLRSFSTRSIRVDVVTHSSDSSELEYEGVEIKPNFTERKPSAKKE
jgi:hypothetical protein